MDCLASKIKSDTIPLSAQDALLSFSNHPLVHFYENTENSCNFMATDALKESLFVALCDFPILLGFISDSDDGTANVVIDKNNLNMPDFQESTSAVRYSDIKNARFSWDSWPNGVATAGPATAPSMNGTIRLVNVHVIRLAENSGVILFCNIPHYILDGVGFYEFLGHWATLYRCKFGLNTAAEPTTTNFNFDRSSLAATLLGLRRPLDDATRDIVLKRSIVSRLLTLLPFTARTRLVSMSMKINYGDGHFFHVSAAALDALHNLAKEHSQNGVVFTSYSLLAALFRMAVSQAHYRQQQENVIVARAVAAASSVVSRLMSTQTDAPHVLLNVVHTYRLTPPEIGCYIGNNIMLYPIIVQSKHPESTTNAEIFAHTAAQVAQAMEGIGKPLLAEFQDTVSANPHAYANISAFMSAQPTALSVIDERHYKTSGADFGGGGPTWISGLPRHMPNFVAFFAASESADEANVYVSLIAPVVKQLLGNVFFTTHAKLLF